MTYSTGSGDYIDLMADVLAHAISDGWTESGGVGTGWPIVSPSGRVRGVDWDTYTATEDDWTLGGSVVSKTQRYIRLGIGTTPAEATTNAALADSPKVPNMAYNFTSWHIFSEPALNEHIHVVVEFSNGIHSDVCGHFSFGEIDKGGLTYNSISYATSVDRRGYAESTSGSSSTPNSSTGSDWNTLNRFGNAFAGEEARNDSGFASFQAIVHSTDAPTPDGVAGWPAWDTLLQRGENFWAAPARQQDSVYPATGIERSGHFGNAAWWPPFNAQTGFVNMMPIYAILINGSITTSRLTMVGQFPNVRFASIDGLNPGDEITIGSDVWKFFPLSRSTEWEQLNVQYNITSGRAGYAYKKVV